MKKTKKQKELDQFYQLFLKESKKSEKPNKKTSKTTKTRINKVVARKSRKNSTKRKREKFYSQKDEKYYQVNTFSKRKNKLLENLTASDYKDVFNAAMKVKTRVFISIGVKMSFRTGNRYESHIVTIPLADAADADINFLYMILQESIDRAFQKYKVFSEELPKATLIWSTLYE